MTMFGVALGVRMTASDIACYGPVMAAISAFLICAAGNIVNDLADIEIDRINRPDRVLVSGLLSRKFAFVLAVIMNLAAIGVALTVNPAVTALGLIAIFLLLAYNLKLKQVPILGNTIIGLLAGLTFISGGLAVDTASTFALPGPLIPAIFAFLFHLVRELVKDVQDIDGDKTAGIRSIPQIIGIRASLWLALGLYLILAAASFIPVYFEWFGRYYRLIVTYIMNLPLGLFLLFICFRPDETGLKALSWALKIGMIVGLVAVWVA